MKATLCFDLPEDINEFTLANSALSYYSVLWDMDQYLRDQIKYNNNESLQVVREQLYELMGKNNVNFRDIE